MLLRPSANSDDRRDATWISKKMRDIGKYRLRARAGWYSMLIGESNVAIDPAIGGYGAADIYLGEFSPHSPLPGTQAGSSANLLLKSIYF